jgi:DNA/RNA-binding domain of Phe-tRNA-synthetase-like protein
MIVTLDIGDVIGAFPGFRVALLAVTGLTVAPELGPGGLAFVAETERRLAADLAGVDPGTIAELRCWREAYRAFGVKKTSYRSSVERLLKTIQRDGRLPRVSAAVDLYNAVSALYRLPIGADDLDRVTLPLAFRHSWPGDSFVALGSTGENDPPKEGEVVYADATRCLCRRWNWYQDARGALGSGTSRAVLTVQGLEPASARRVEEAAARLASLLAAECGASCAWTVADASHPRVEIEKTSLGSAPEAAG